MKKLKKLGSVLLALAVMFVMTSTAFGNVIETGQYTLTLSGGVSGHTYNLYQIFTGDVSANKDTNAETKYVLSNIKYGKNYIPGGKNVGDKVPSTELQSITKEFAQTVNPTGGAFRTVKAGDGGTVTFSDLPAGYYLVKDSKTSASEENDSIPKFMLQVVGDTSAVIKGGVPAVEKKIVDADSVKVDVADYNIGDTVNFEITGTLPSNYNEYSKYKYELYDTLSTGLSYNNDAKVFVKNGDNRVEVTSQTTISHENGNLTIKFADLKTLTGVTISSTSEIIVEYSAILNNNAVIGLDGNPNEVYLKFSNNPNNGGSGEMGKTPTDQVVVFTYELDVTKVDGKDNTTKLQGAEFVLLNSAGKFATVSGGKVTGWVDETNEYTTLTSDAEGLFVISGLDAGTYKLREIKAPEGYNLMDKDVEFTISATLNQTDGYLGTAKDALTALTIKVGETTTNGVLSTGIVTTTVVNNAGTVLPSTGGIGTTLFYVIGGVLVLAAIVLLVTRRRMREE